LWAKVASAQLALKDYDRCNATLDRWHTMVKPPPPVIEDMRGDIALEKEKFKEAETHWLAFVAAKPPRDDAAKTYDKLANLYVAQSRWQENLDCRTHVVALRDTAANRVARATALLRLHRWDDAYAEIEKANKLDASDAMVKEWLPQFERLERFIPRLKELDAEIAKTPNESKPLLDQARLFTLADRPLLALENCEKALKIQPASMRVRIQTAEARLDTSDPDGAAKLGVSGKLKRDYYDKHVSDSALLELDKQDAVLQRDPKNVEALVMRAQVLHNLNQFTLALADGQAALAIEDKSAGAHSAVAHDLDELGQKKEALEQARRATELSPQDWMKWAFRGMLEKERADYAAAIDSFSRALSIQPDSTVSDERENCERRLGRTK
jgi:tetratricopeptide (TPR) repeat protein